MPAVVLRAYLRLAMTTEDSDLASGEARTSITYADDERVDDILVFGFAHEMFRVIGGRGRGAGWADIVEVRASEEPIIERVWRSGVPVRISETSAVRIVGPYWAKHAAGVAV